MSVFERGGCIYIMTNKIHTVLYVGVTSNLYQRVLEHKSHKYPGSFTDKYNCEKLVYYCQYSTITEAILEEKRVKGRNRKYKESLVNGLNPLWCDLWEDVKLW